jgi:hypothetical protein
MLNLIFELMSNTISNTNGATLNGEQGFLLMLLNEEVAITTAMIADYIWQDLPITKRLNESYKLAVAFVEKYPVGTIWETKDNPKNWDEIIHEFVRSEGFKTKHTEDQKAAYF